MTLIIRHKGTMIAKMTESAGLRLEALLPDMTPTAQHGKYRLTCNTVFREPTGVHVYLWADDTTVTVEN